MSVVALVLKLVSVQQNNNKLNKKKELKSSTYHGILHRIKGTEMGGWVESSIDNSLEKISLSSLFRYWSHKIKLVKIQNHV